MKLPSSTRYTSLYLLIFAPLCSIISARAFTSHSHLHQPRASLFDLSSYGDSCTDDSCATKFNTTDGGVSACRKAIRAFGGTLTYNSQTVYTSGHCAATFACAAVQNFKGSDIQAQFATLFSDGSGAGALSGAGCKACGVHYFTANTTNVQCVVTTAYCSSCQNSGGPVDSTVRAAFGDTTKGTTASTTPTS